MKRKISILGIVCLLVLTGCASRPEERPLPTLAPEVQEQKEDSESVTTGETEESEEKMSFGGLGVDIIRYVERSRMAKDENLVATLKSAIELACFEYISDGTKLPEEPIRFRYTHELEELDDAYFAIKETIREIVGDNEITLSDEDSYMMVTISRQENGNPEIEVKIMQE